MPRTSTRATWTVACAFVMLVATTLVAQQLARPAADPSEITRMVCQMIEANHLRQGEIDDQTADKLFTQWFSDLDPQKLYFLMSDIGEFSRDRSSLDDSLKKGNLDFGHATFARYLERQNERIDYAHKLIDASHDFTAKETMSTDHKSQVWAETVEELNERWRKRIKFEIAMLKLEKETDETIRTKLHKRYRSIREAIRQTEKNEVMEMYLTSLCTTFDPHSSYMLPRTHEHFLTEMKNELSGIGAVLRSEDGVTIVAEVVGDGPAATDGRLKPGDKIVGVSDEKGDILEIADMRLTKVVEMIRGKAGTVVKLKVQTKEDPEPKVYELTRAKVLIKSRDVKGEIIETSGRLKGSSAKVGVISIPSFYRDFQGAEEGADNFKSTVRDVAGVLQDFKAKGGVDLVVVDLRDNPGGALAEAIEVSGLFIDRGPVVQVKDVRQRVKPLVDDQEGVLCKEPLVVLINRHSASASEIFAGAIKDYGRGIVVGDHTTHGKGTVQSVMEVGPRLAFGKQPDRGSMKVTIQQFYRVNGDSTQNQGVPADVALPSLLDIADEGEAGLDNALPFEHIDPARYSGLGMASREMIASLQESSRGRVKADAEFQKVEADIKRYLSRKERKAVSLNLEELQKERAEGSKDPSEPDAGPEEPPRKSDAPIFPDGPYTNEVLAIAVDYLHLLAEARTASK